MSSADRIFAAIPVSPCCCHVDFYTVNQMSEQIYLGKTHIGVVLQFGEIHSVPSQGRRQRIVAMK